jgi:hypothetical protein
MFTFNKNNIDFNVNELKLNLLEVVIVNQFQLNWHSCFTF